MSDTTLRAQEDKREGQRFSTQIKIANDAVEEATTILRHQQSGFASNHADELDAIRKRLLEIGVEVALGWEGQ